MSDAGYGGPSDKKPGQYVEDKKPQKKPANKPQDRSPKEKASDKAAKRAKQKQANQVAAIVEDFTGYGGGGAPIDAEFVEAALAQGLTPKDIRAILRTNVLSTGLGVTGGGNANFSSSALVDFFTDNPQNFGALLEAVKANAGASDNYADFLANGGAPGEFRSADQLLQEALFGIEGTKEAYLSATPFAKYVAEGNDPARWYADRDEFIGGLAAEAGFEDGNGGGEGGGQAPAPTSPGISYQGGFDVDGLNDFGFGDVVSQMMAARQQRMNAQMAQGDVFNLADLAGSEE